MRAWLQLLVRTGGVLLVAFLLVYVFYFHHTLKYPPQRQKSDAEFRLTFNGIDGLPKQAVVWASDQRVLRPWAEYFTGVLLTMRRSEQGGGLFFRGRFYDNGLRRYFPYVYLVKEPLALHLLTIMALVLALWRLRAFRHPRKWLEAHLTEFAFLVVVGVYWFAAIRSNLNVGVRHVLPTFPFIYILVSGEITSLYKRLANPAEAQNDSRRYLINAQSHTARKGTVSTVPQKALETGASAPEVASGNLTRTPIASDQNRAAPRPVALRVFSVVLGALLLWQAVSVVRVHPSYLAYFNEIAGGPDGGWQTVTDSNLDWGQDLKRLAQFVESRGIQEIHLDYFGTGDPVYYLKNKYIKLTSCDAPQRGWVAVSNFDYVGSRAVPQCDYQRWLPMDKLVAKIGYSIFVFRID